MPVTPGRPGLLSTRALRPHPFDKCFTAARTATSVSRYLVTSSRTLLTPSGVPHMLQSPTCSSLRLKSVDPTSGSNPTSTLLGVALRSLEGH